MSFGCNADEEQLDETKRASVALMSGSLQWIQGCGTYTTAWISLDITASSSEAIEQVDLSAVNFEGWWEASEDLDRLGDTSSFLPIGPVETATLDFQLDMEGGFGECSSFEPPPQVPLSVQVLIDGVAYDVEANGTIGCGWDEPPEGGC